MLTDATPNLLDKVFWIFASFVGAIVTYYLIEQPFRNRQSVSSKLFFIVMGVVFIFLIALNTLIYKSNGLADRPNEFNQKVVTDYWLHIENREKFWTYKGCWWNEDYRSKNPTPFAECLTNEQPFTSPKIMLIGDSNLAGLVPGLIDAYGRTSVIQRIVTGCLPVISTEDREICQIGIANAFEEIERLKPDLVIVGGKYDTQKDFDLFEETFGQYLTDYKDKIALFGAVPRWGTSNTRQYMVPRLRGLHHTGQIDLSEEAIYLAPDDLTFKLEEMGQTLSNKLGVAYISPVQVFCQQDQGLCLAKINQDKDSITTWDYGHLTMKASIYFIEKIKSDIDEMMAD